MTRTGGRTEENRRKVAEAVLGIMGKPMARNLLRAGYSLVIHSRSQASVDEIAGEGAKRAASPQEVASLVDVVILMLPDSDIVERVLLGRLASEPALTPGSAGRGLLRNARLWQV